MGDVSTADNEKLGRNKRKYSVQLREYANKALNDDELKIYQLLFEEIRERNNIVNSEDIMMLDLAVFDFIRAKRLHNHIRKTGDMIEFKTDRGTFVKANEASYLLNAIESQFRQNMKELLLTRKEGIKKMLLTGDKDFANWIKADIIDVKTEKADG